jgi:NAD(P)-dependent dehydrogenase (short-subunit alcohol dehydrogenase family)
MDLTDRVVLITGTRRIGGVVAEAVARRGADVALVHRRSAQEAEEAADQVRAAGRRALIVQADVSDPGSVANLFVAVERDFGRLDVLINMASLYDKVAFDAMTERDWHRQLSVDLHGSFLVSRAAVPLLRRAGGGRIINFTDWVAASARPRYRGYVAYYVAKAGVKALTEALALELADDQILVNAIAPGPVLPPEGTPDSELAAVEKSTPLGRWGGAAEVAKAVLALIDADFVTGETVRVDGGRHLY